MDTDQHTNPSNAVNACDFLNYRSTNDSGIFKSRLVPHVYSDHSVFHTVLFGCHDGLYERSGLDRGANGTEDGGGPACLTKLRHLAMQFHFIERALCALFLFQKKLSESILTREKT